MCFVEYLHNIPNSLFCKEAEMKKFLLSLVCYGFSSDEIEDRNAYYLGCKAYPPGHYKAYQTGNQHTYQQAACKAFGLCHW